MAYYKYDGSLAVTTGAATRSYAGTSGRDTLTGTSANESFTGGQGDTMVGGAGDDTYYVSSSKDVVTEYAGGGIDRISAWRSISLANFANVENVSVSGDNNYAAGNALNNIVEGREGAQQIYGGLGQDVLIGGAAADVFIVNKGEGNDVIQDFTVAEDKVRLKAGFTSFTEVQAHLTQAGADVKLDLGGGDGLMFRNLKVADLTAADFQLGFDPKSVGALTFSDEFNKPLSYWDAVDAPGGVWRTDYGFQGSNGVGSYTLSSNNELQIYTSPFFRDHKGDFAESPFVSNADGTLSIWARASSNAEIFGYHYTSGALTTKPTFSQTYGYFEIRASVPKAAGAWPAFWLVPTDGSWPPELDVMEILGKDSNVAYTSAHTVATGSHTKVTQANYIPDTGDGMHTYGTLWTASELVYYIDGVEVFRTATPADMNKPMHMIINMAVGGWGGDVAAGALPAEFKIDYVRAYALPTVVAAPALPTINGSALNDTLVGTAAAEVLYGLAGNDKLDGKAGADTLYGGAGDDTYYVDNAADLAVELAGEGADTVMASTTFTLAANIETLSLCGPSAINGTGNELANVINGNGAANTLWGMAGNDRINGAAGADTAYGGAGDDTYYVENAADRTIELAGEGADTVIASTTFTLSANIETLTLGGSAAINGTGNELANTITGNGAGNSLWGMAGNDRLNGAAGADKMYGGAGDDIYYVDNAGDLAVELAGEGVDTVIASVSATLRAEVENLTLTGSAANGVGNDLANIICGNSAANTLSGGGGDDRISGGVGADVLSGGAGADTFVYSGLADSTLAAADRITDFDASVDHIDLRNIDANPGLAGNQAFTWVDDFSHHAGEAMLAYDAVLGVHTLSLDANGDGVADFRLVIAGAVDTGGFYL